MKLISLAFPLTLSFVDMVLISVLNNALNAICNAERRGKRQVLIRPSSKVVIKFLTVMMKHGKFVEKEKICFFCVVLCVCVCVCVLKCSAMKAAQLITYLSLYIKLYPRPCMHLPCAKKEKGLESFFLHIYE